LPAQSGKSQCFSFTGHQLRANVIDGQTAVHHNNLMYRLSLGVIAIAAVGRYFINLTAIATGKLN